MDKIEVSIQQLEEWKVAIGGIDACMSGDLDVEQDEIREHYDCLEDLRSIENEIELLINSSQKE